LVGLLGQGTGQSQGQYLHGRAEHEKENKDKTSYLIFRTVRKKDVAVHQRHKPQGFGLQSCHGKLRSFGRPVSVLLLVHNSLFVEV
jgi:hypothetical protein